MKRTKDWRKRALTTAVVVAALGANAGWETLTGRETIANASVARADETGDVA